MSAVFAIQNDIPGKERDMRAFAVRSFDEAPAIYNLPVPAADGTFLIRVRYAGINPIDSKLLEKLTATSTYPFVRREVLLFGAARAHY